MLFIDDSDHFALARSTTEWYRLTLHELRNRGYIELSPDNDIERAIFSGRTTAEYSGQRGLATHSAVDHRNSLGGFFRIQSEERTPYLYRFLSAVVPSGEPGARLVRTFLAQESAAIEQGLLEPVGRRVIAVKKS